MIMIHPCGFRHAMVDGETGVKILPAPSRERELDMNQKQLLQKMFLTLKEEEAKTHEVTAGTVSSCSYLSPIIL